MPARAGTHGAAFERAERREAEDDRAGERRDTAPVRGEDEPGDDGGAEETPGAVKAGEGRMDHERIVAEGGRGCIPALRSRRVARRRDGGRR